MVTKVRLWFLAMLNVSPACRCILIYIVWLRATCARKTPRWPVKGVTHKPFNLTVSWGDTGTSCEPGSGIWWYSKAIDNDNAQRWPQSNFRFHFVNVASWTRFRPSAHLFVFCNLFFLHICREFSLRSIFISVAQIAHETCEWWVHKTNL